MPSIAPTTSRPRVSQPVSPWFWVGIVLLFLGSLAIRFWGLSRFNTLVFDEVYYAKFASQFLRGDIVFTGHPPLSTYIIAIGIWLGNLLPWGSEGAKNGLTGLLLSPFSYRWLNAFTGAWIPLVVAAIAYQLTRRPSYALLSGLLMALDGLFLVESRYALNNVYLILFGLLGHLGLLLALRAEAMQRWLWVAAAGLGFGAAAAIKWNGLGFLLGTYGIWILAWIIRWISGWIDGATLPLGAAKNPEQQSPLANLTQLHLGHIVIGLAVMPALAYYLSWVPYMIVDPTDSGFWALQLETYDYHRRVGGLDAHPYCSLWYTWPLMLRPVAYFYKTAQGFDDPVSVVGPPLPIDVGAVVYDVHAMGNPMLWWFSTAAVVVLLGLLVQQLRRGLSHQQAEWNGKPSRARLNLYSWTVLYLLVNWAANFLPWVRVTRCLFLYHYMASLVFAVLGLALLLDRWLRSSQSWQKTTGVVILGLTVAGFIFWMPLFLGLPLAPEALELRRWLPSWV